jgi:hypothetical protein
MKSASVPAEVFSQEPLARQGFPFEAHCDRLDVKNSTSAAAIGFSADPQGVTPFPYVPLIRKLVQEERIPAARSLLSKALSQSWQTPELWQLQRVLAPPVALKSDQRGQDRTAEINWLAANGQYYNGEWVAVAGEKLLAHATALTTLLHELRGNPLRDRSIIHWIEPG